MHGSALDGISRTFDARNGDATTTRNAARSCRKSAILPIAQAPGPGRKDPQKQNNSPRFLRGDIVVLLVRIPQIIDAPVTLFFRAKTWTANHAVLERDPPTSNPAPAAFDVIVEASNKTTFKSKTQILLAVRSVLPTVRESDRPPVVHGLPAWRLSFRRPSNKGRHLWSLMGCGKPTSLVNAAKLPTYRRSALP